MISNGPEPNTPNHSKRWQDALTRFFSRTSVELSIGALVLGSVVLTLLEFTFGETAHNRQQQAMLLSMFALMLPTILLSGFIFPIENMPHILQLISHVMPSKWFIIIIKNIMLKGVGIGYFWKETLIIAGMTLFFIGMSVKKFKIRLD